MAALLLCALCASMSGCLIPQDDQVPGELPPKRNGPIKIQDQIPRDRRITFFNGTTCSNASFQLFAEDEDLADLVFSLWFIGSTNETPFQPTPIQGGTATRVVNAPSSLAFKSTLANHPTGTETITVYVADTQFKEVVGGNIALVERPDRVLPDASTVRDTGSFDTFTWTLDVTAPSGNCQ